MTKQERIVCAAVKVVVTKEDYSGTHIFKGLSYEDIYDDGILRYVAHPSFTNIFRNGFITNHNRFVDPKNAFVIAVNAQQVTPRGGNDIPDLKPEDLY